MIRTNTRPLCLWESSGGKTIDRTYAAYVRYIKQHGKGTGPVDWPAGIHHSSDSGLKGSVCAKLLKELRTSVYPSAGGRSLR